MTTATPTRDLRPLSGRVQARLTALSADPPGMADAVLAQDWLPPAEAGFDADCPELPAVREEHESARRRLAAASERLADARQALQEVQDRRKEVADAGEVPPSPRDAEEAVSDAELLEDAAMDHLAEVAAGTFVRVRELLPEWEGAAGRVREARDELRREAEAKLAEAERLARGVRAFEAWTERVGHRGGGPGAWLMPYAALDAQVDHLAETADARDPRISAALGDGGAPLAGARIENTTPSEEDSP